MKNRYKIKLLSGPLAGRQLFLPEGDFRIGGDDPDLDLTPEGGHTAVLTVTETGVALQTQARCWLDGKATAELPDVIPADVVVDVGGVVLMVGDAEHTFREASVPDRNDAIPPGRARRVLAAVSLIVVAAGAVGGGVWSYATLAAGTVQADPNAWRSGWEADAAREGLALKTRPDGLLELAGRCRSAGDRGKLTARLREHGVIFRDVTLCQDDLVRNVKALLLLHGFDEVRVTPDEAIGEVKIAGRILADARWQKAVAAMATLRGLDAWTVEDDTGESVKALIGMLRKTDLIGKLSVAREKGMILLTGVLDEGGKRALGSVLSAFSTQFPSAPRTVVQNIPTARIQADIFPAPVVSFGGRDELAFLDLANGTRVKNGSRLPTGYVIVGIDRNGIDLEREGELMHIPLEL